MDLTQPRFKLNKNIPIPLYYQVKRMILNELANGNLTQGDKLPAEIEFCEHLQLSRPTVRMALTELVAEGILTRKKRSGTFIAEPKIELKLSTDIEQLKPYIEQTTRECQVEVLDFCVVGKIDEINQRLNIEHNDSLIYLKRLWRVNDVPFAYNAVYLPEKSFVRILDKDFTYSNLFQVLAQEYDVKATSKVVKIESVLASKNDIDLLEINRTRASLLYMADVVKDEHLAPICWSITRYRGDKFFINYEIDL